MADNMQVFQDSMARGREFQSQNQWESALREYYKAATEVKTDLEARAGVANALAKLGRNDQAFTQYQALVKVRPNNPELVRGFAETLAKLGRKEEAITAFYRLRDIAKANNLPIQRIEALSDVITLDEGRTDAYFEIIEVYAAQGDKPSAAAVGVELARYYKNAGDYKQALEIITDVIQIDPNNTDAPALKVELEKGPPPPGSTKKTASDESEFGDLPDLDSLESMAATVAVTNPVNVAPAKPDVEESADTVVIKLESSAPVAASAPPPDSTRLIADAELFLEKGEIGPAIQHYEMAVEAGAHRADVYYSLGQLYAQENQAEPSIKYLQKAAADPEYATSAYFSLGQVYDALGQLGESGEAYDQALATMDLGGIDGSSIDELIDMYDMAVDVHQRNLKPDKASELYQKLAEFIQNKNLRTDKSMLVLVKAREMSAAAQPQISEPSSDDLNNNSREDSTAGLAEFGEETGTGSKLHGFSSTISFGTATEDNFIKTIGTNGHLGNSGEDSVAELLDDGGLALTEAKASSPSEPAIPAIFPDELIRMEPNQYATPYLRAAEDFIRRDLTMAAMDACHEVIRYFPGYLPAQAILSEIYVKKGWLEQARQKYQFLVDLYTTREEKIYSIWCYKRLANISPNNFPLRSRLANLMMSEGMNAEAAELLLDNIDNFVRSGQTERALEECKRLRALAPNSAPIRLQYGDLLNRLERHSEALGEFRRALELDPNNFRALALLNITIFLIDSSDVRWTSLNSVVEVMNKDKETRNSIVSEYRQMLLLFNHPGLNYAMGCFMLNADQKAAAERSFDETLRFASTTPNMKDYELLSRWELGQLFLASGRTQPAVDSLSKIVNLLEAVDATSFAPSTMRYGSLPSQAIIYRKLAQGFNAEGQHEYALKALKTVKKLIPYDRDLYFELAEMYFVQGQLTEALGELGELADHYEQVNQTEKVIDVLREMVRLAPNRIEVRDKLSQVYLNRGMTDEGLAELDELAELQRKNGRMKDAVRTLQRGAEIYFMMARMDRAYELYDRIVRIAPGDLDARQHLVNLHILAGRHKDAIEEQRTIAQICLQSGNSQDAIGALHQVIGLSPNDTRAYFTLADVLKSGGKFGEAYRLYKRIVKLEPNNEKAKTLQTQVKQKAIDAGQLDKE